MAVPLTPNDMKKWLKGKAKKIKRKIKTKDIIFIPLVLNENHEIDESYDSLIVMEMVSYAGIDILNASEETFDELYGLMASYSKIAEEYEKYENSNSNNSNKEEKDE